MATPVASVTLNSDGTWTGSGSLIAIAPLIQDAFAKTQAGFSLPALLKLVQDLAVDVPVIIADVTAVLAAPAPAATSDAPLHSLGR